MQKLAIALVAASVLAGCASQKSFETEPVVVSTRAGDVTCQLYSAKLLIWDEAIDLPVGMRLIDADNICQYAGQRQMDGEDPRVPHPQWAPEVQIISSAN